MFQFRIRFRNTFLQIDSNSMKSNTAKLTYHNIMYGI